MPIGKINKLGHLSQRTYQATSKLVPRHNDKGYGTIVGERGRKVYFSHDAVPGSRGFDDLRRGENVEYTLENGQQLRADFGSFVPTVPARLRRPSVHVYGEGQ